MSTLTWPKVVGMEVTQHSAPTPDATAVTDALNAAYRGAVSHDGKWTLEAAAGWTVSRIATGHYKVVHNLGNTQLLLHISLLVQPGSFHVTSHTPVDFEVQTTLNSIPTDFDWMFSIAKVVAPVALPASQSLLPS